MKKAKSIVVSGPTTTMTPSIFPVLPQEIITEILLKLSPKPLLKFKCVSKSLNGLISSPEFVKTHLKLMSMDKECSHYKVMSPKLEKQVRVCSLPSLFYEQQSTELLPIDRNLLRKGVVGSVNGLICFVTKEKEGELERERERELYLWNPTTRKGKILTKLPLTVTNYINHDVYSGHRYGFGYDEIHDDYKVVFIVFVSREIVVYIYSLRTNSWKTNRTFQGGYLRNYPAKFVNGKLYWAWASSVISRGNFSYIVSLDLADETWEKLEPPSYGKDNSQLILGVGGSDISVLCIDFHGTSSEVWILKDCGVNKSWTKMFTIEFPTGVFKHVFSIPFFSFSIHFSRSNEGKILLLLPPDIMIYNPKDGSTRQLEVTGFGKYREAKIYVESLVDPLLIADAGTL